MKQWLLIVLATLALTACNTMRGIGQDVSKGGQAIENAAKDVSNKM
ncbi:MULTISPECIES: entericidin A/B family lipoprotein [Aquitalea]|uniref:Putative small secreted protein n=1 Tax=Aquitalea magnusonii TaxID=332411 RepID=A0A318JAX5_9NEIS|nr:MULTISPECIES: entericidin A/B family lipoprotein [Aquitalea]PXX45626.1 putative small secreted protein [Aquitalea magnusonii]